MVKVSPIRGLQSEPIQGTKNLPTRGASAGTTKKAHNAMETLRRIAAIIAYCLL